MTPAQPNDLTRLEIAAVLRRHRGSIKRVAAELDLHHVTIVHWLDGRSTSKRVAVAAKREAMKLVAEERKATNAA